MTYVARACPFFQVDVFSSTPYLGNPVAVVADAAGLEDGDKQRIARWTNLSETTFLLPASTPDADYRVRIFTPGGELPFAGHPTLGSAHAWLEGGGTPLRTDRIVQECGAGLIDVQRNNGVLSFAAPATVRTGGLEREYLAGIVWYVVLVLLIGRLGPMLQSPTFARRAEAVAGGALSGLGGYVLVRA